MAEAVEFLVESVTDNSNLVSVPMVVREYRKIGEGAFGTVVQAKLIAYDTYKSTQTSTNGNGQASGNSAGWIGPYAIKRVPAQTEYKSRELEILRITNHPNVIKLCYFFNYRSPQDQKVYQHLAMECLPETLQLEIRRYTALKQSLPLLHIKIYCYQIARAMLYLHALGICHRDIKPSNILVDPNSGVLKICDFGSAKRLEPQQPSVAYICSRYYRAPELIVGCTLYTTQIDIWGLGCVLGEMFLGRAVFQGADPYLQLREISKLLGPPDKRFVFNSNPRYNGPLYSKPLYTGQKIDRFKQIFPGASEPGYDLLLNVLQYEPLKRYTPVQVMSHPFFNDLKSANFTWTPRGQESPVAGPNFFNFSSFELDLIGSSLQRIAPIH